MLEGAKLIGAGAATIALAGAAIGIGFGLLGFLFFLISLMNGRGKEKAISPYKNILSNYTTGEDDDDDRDRKKRYRRREAFDSQNVNLGKTLLKSLINQLIKKNGIELNPNSKVLGNILDQVLQERLPRGPSCEYIAEVGRLTLELATDLEDSAFFQRVLVLLREYYQGGASGSGN